MTIILMTAGILERSLSNPAGYTIEREAVCGGFLPARLTLWSDSGMADGALDRNYTAFTVAKQRICKNVPYKTAVSAVYCAISEGLL